MPDRICSIDGCDKAAYQNKAQCGSHFMKLYRHGDPHFTHTVRYQDVTGQRFGMLTAIARAHGRWLCRCDCGMTTTVWVGDLNRGTAITCGDRAAHRRVETPAYCTMHDRLRADQGPARSHPCHDCGRQANSWSYDHTCPNEIQSDAGPYSVDPAHYQPRCLPCHRRLDFAQARRRRRSA